MREPIRCLAGGYVALTRSRGHRVGGRHARTCLDMRLTGVGNPTRGQCAEHTGDTRVQNSTRNSDMHVKKKKKKKKQ